MAASAKQTPRLRPHPFANQWSLLRERNLNEIKGSGGFVLERSLTDFAKHRMQLAGDAFPKRSTIASLFGAKRGLKHRPPAR